MQRPPRARVLASGSPRLSSAPTAERSRPRAPAPIAAPPCPSICLLQRLQANPRSVPMTETNSVVLVVDDEVQIRRFLRAGLELDGFSVQDAENGADVLERLRAWSTVPLIVLSVRSNEAEKVRLLESGADDYVVKPFGMAEL